MNEKHVIQRFVKAKKLFSRYAILVMLCSFGVISAQQNDEKIAGVVLEESSNKPVLGANIYVVESKQGVMADQNGEFTINAKKGETLVISYIGYMMQIPVILTTQFQFKVTIEFQCFL
ncbi:hypothetical protein D3C85_83520 [compost metagenome]